MSSALEHVVHGRSGWMHHKCRCEVCHQDLLDYAQLRRAIAAVRAGRNPASRVSATHARRRVGQLRRAGWTVQAIADAADVNRVTIDRVANRRLANVALATERAVLELRP